MANQDSVVNGVQLTRENFTDPPLELGIVPFWFWNGDLEYDELEWQLREYYDRGVRSLFIHGRMGLNVGYLSGDWFDRVQFVVDKAKEIGIDTWVYDEMDWPSGTADQQVLEADPELSQRYLELVALHINGPIFTFLEAHDDRYVNTGNSNPIAAYGVRQEQYETVITELIDLNKNLSWEKTIPWEAPAGKWVLLYFLEKQAPYYIDTLNPASTEKFLELTHERYKKAVGKEFGKTVPGFFTDEPAMYYYHVGLQNYVIPWSRQMFKIFRDRRGYDLKPHLPALYADMGSDTARIRYDFWRTLTEQYSETYYKRIREWCDENGVIFTGHLLFEEWLRLSARCEGNLFKYLQHMHLIGVDHLYPKIGTEDDPAEHVALKVGSSAAHHFGSTRLLCESMGGTYWNCTLERMKWLNNWEYVLGVNLFNNHGYHYTIEGERKRDWPPSQFYHHTWWKYYDRFTHYNARLSHALSGGRHVAKVLMLYPINSMWTNYVPQERGPLAAVTEDDFNYLTDTLLRLHFDFDYVDEDVLADATVEDGLIKIADEEFSVLILPPVTHIKESTFGKLQEFVDSGGNVIADTILPVGLLEGGSNGEIVGNETFFGFDTSRIKERFLSGLDLELTVSHRNSQGNVFVLEGPGLHKLRPKEELREILYRCIVPDVTISEEAVFYLHRVKDDLDLYFLTNTSQADLGAVVVTFEKVGKPELWNPNTGTVTPLHEFSVVDGRLVVELEFPPSEAHFVVIDGPIEGSHVTKSNLRIEAVSEDEVVGFGTPPTGDDAYAVVALKGHEQRLSTTVKPARKPIMFPASMPFETEPDNALLIEKFRMDASGGASLEDGVHKPDFDDGDWLEVTPGAWEMQLPFERDEQVYPVSVWYRAYFEVVDMPDRLALLIDGFSGSRHQLWINGSEITEPGKRSWLDAEIKEVDILPHCGVGKNWVAIRIDVTRRTDGLLDPIKIVGPFALRSADDEQTVVKMKRSLSVGDWTGQGYPFFSGTGIYRAHVEVPGDYLDGGRIYLEADCGEDVLEVRLNGGEPLVAPWHPYRVDVTDQVRAGSNEFEIRITNTLLNLLEGSPQASGLFAAPRLVHEHRYSLKADA